MLRRILIAGVAIVLSTLAQAQDEPIQAPPSFVELEESINQLKATAPTPDIQKATERLNDALYENIIDKGIANGDDVIQHKILKKEANNFVNTIRNAPWKEFRNANTPQSEYIQSSFKCLDDYNRCNSRNSTNLCVAIMLICEAKAFIS